MRGSPLMRTLAVLIALLVAGIGLSRLTSASPRLAGRVDDPPAMPTAVSREAGFELLLSAEAKHVRLEAGGDPVVFAATAGPIRGKLPLADGLPTLFLEVEWAREDSAHRFAKLRLEVPGEETVEHVFSAPGDIDDIWEP